MTMADRIRVEYEQLTTISNKFSDQGERINQLIGRLSHQSRELCSGGWHGVGADSFYDEMETLILPALEKLFISFDESHTVINRISQIFAEAEEEGASLFGMEADISIGSSIPSTNLQFSTASMSVQTGSVLGANTESASSRYSYVASVNQPLLNKLLDAENSLQTYTSDLETLHSEREMLQSERTSLHNRLDDLNEVSGDNVFSWLEDGAEYLGGRISGEYGRVQDEITALESRIADIDSRIDSNTAEIQTIQETINNITTRLDRVTPPAGANLDIIKRMENGTTESWLRPYTLWNGEGTCTTHIIDRIAIPREIIANAKDWNDRAISNPQYGIQVGQQPLTGSVLVMEQVHPYASAGGGNTNGHVMYVERVEGGEIYITDNNHSNPITLSSLGISPTGEHISYLYIPWNTQG